MGRLANILATCLWQLSKLDADSQEEKRWPGSSNSKQ